ncbi:hypothetical protein BT96DRAFT_926063 [Gymnopus androsaceus JB14]|uniref:Uncharacterized protein n=1 Tax=Gymnopus androsaceus JB14 TaxID=1447944 RepID=A0A6A4GYM9_9AGAR|nr:hypothetical protein BT96DRAFT_926063 [Gymnopus androsaceus JB14]
MVIEKPVEETTLSAPLVTLSFNSYSATVSDDNPIVLSSLSPHGNTYDATFFQFTVNKSLQKHRKSLLSSVLDFFENNVCGCGQKLSTIVLHLRFFSLYADPSELVGHCGRGLAEDSHMEWNFRCMNNAPAKFVNPVGRGSEKEYLELGEVMYHADFPEYCLSGVFDLLGP